MVIAGNKQSLCMKLLLWKGSLNQNRNAIVVCLCEQLLEKRCQVNINKVHIFDAFSGCRNFWNIMNFFFVFKLKHSQKFPQPICCMWMYPSRFSSTFSNRSIIQARECDFFNLIHVHGFKNSHSCRNCSGVTYCIELKLYDSPYFNT